MKSLYHNFTNIVKNYSNIGLYNNYKKIILFAFFTLFILLLFKMINIYNIHYYWAYHKHLPIILNNTTGLFNKLYYIILSFYDIWYDLFYLLSKFNNYPLFLFSCIFFLLTTIFSFINIYYLGLYGVFIINLVSLFLTWLSFLSTIRLLLLDNLFYYINCGSWINLNSNYRISFDFLIDNVSLSFSLLTTSIAIFVYIYTFSYFRYEPHVDRLLLFLNMFILSMVFLVCSGNLVMIFLGWELIGLTSFFLINFWSTKISTFKCAFKAFSFNKLSDFFLLFFILAIFSVFNSVDLLTVLNTMYLYYPFKLVFFNINISFVEILGVFLLGACFIKSAQIGFHIWLPDSMEAPVPASALIHSATLVSAGIFLLLRFTIIFENSSFLLSIIFFFGSLTAFYGGLVASFQTDCKRLLAYSTISHCGFLMVLFVTLELEYVIIYLYIHGFFKAATFLSVGNIMRFAKTQDFRRMGFFYKYLPFDAYATLIGVLNLGGLPFSLGFYMKHILIVALNTSDWLYIFNFCLCLGGALTGLFYSSRLYYNVFFDTKKAHKGVYKASSDNTLNSIYYTNAGVGGVLAISALILVAYFIIFYLLYLYLININIFSDINTYKFLNLTSDVLIDRKSSALLYTIINYIIIFLILFIVFTPWRTITIRSKVWVNFFNIIFFFTFLHFFLNILT